MTSAAGNVAFAPRRVRNACRRPWDAWRECLWCLSNADEVFLVVPAADEACRGDGETIGKKLSVAMEYVVRVVPACGIHRVGPLAGLHRQDPRAILPPLWDAFQKWGTALKRSAFTIASAIQKLLPEVGGLGDSALNLTNPFDAVTGLADLAASALGRLTDYQSSRKR